MVNTQKTAIIAEDALACSQKGKFPQRFNFENHEFILYKNVFSPNYFKGSHVYIKHLPLSADDSFLDMGCGCGIIGIEACLRYKLKKVVCADVNGYAIKNTKRNIELHHLENKISAIKSDVYANIPLQKFDLIFWNAPYFDGINPFKSILYVAMYDTNYQHIKRFITEGQKYLKPNGKIMIGFSSDKFPLERTQKLLAEIGYKAEIYYQGKDPFGIKQEILDIVKI